MGVGGTGVKVNVNEGVGLGIGVKFLVGGGEGVNVRVSARVAVSPCVGVGVGDCVLGGVLVGLIVGVFAKVRVELGVSLGVGVFVRLGTFIGVLVCTNTALGVLAPCEIWLYTIHALPPNKTATSKNPVMNHKNFEPEPALVVAPAIGGLVVGLSGPPSGGIDGGSGLVKPISASSFFPYGVTRSVVPSVAITPAGYNFSMSASSVAASIPKSCASSARVA